MRTKKDRKGLNRIVKSSVIGMAVLGGLVPAYGVEASPQDQRDAESSYAVRSVACGGDYGKGFYGSAAKSPASALEYESSDATLQRSFDWAKGMALSYAHGGGDAVGEWCEAALPEREAFCIRDVAHQSIGAHLLGLAAQNANMMGKFTKNISESRDWCTYWEMDRYDRPAPIDYESDEEFWYNLNANFDIINMAWRLYNWTGDRRYVLSSDFTNFCNRTLDDYVARWQLEPNRIMSRPRYMNRDESIEPDNRFYHCRGIPSYVENFPGICVGLDLLGALYGGHKAAAEISRINVDLPDRSEIARRGEEYRELMEREWWDEEGKIYHTFYTEDGTFASGEGIPFALWFGIIEEGSRRDAAVMDILSRDWNIENLSYFPALLLDLGYAEEAYRLIGELPDMNRSEYPEVSYGMIEALVRSGMGIRPDATRRSVTTEYRLGEKKIRSEARQIPMFGGYINLLHDGDEESRLTNMTGEEIEWIPLFNGKEGGRLKVAPGATLTIHPRR